MANIGTVEGVLKLRDELTGALDRAAGELKQASDRMQQDMRGLGQQAERATKELERTGREAERLADSYKQADAPAREMGRGLDGIENALGRVGQRGGSTRSIIRGVGQEFTGMAAGAVLLSMDLAQLGETVEILEERVPGLADGLERLRESVSRFAGPVSFLNALLRDTLTAWDNLAAAIESNRSVFDLLTGDTFEAVKAAHDYKTALEAEEQAVRGQITAITELFEEFQATGRISSTVRAGMVRDIDQIISELEKAGRMVPQSLREIRASLGGDFTAAVNASAEVTSRLRKELAELNKDGGLTARAMDAATKAILSAEGPAGALRTRIAELRRELQESRGRIAEFKENIEGIRESFRDIADAEARIDAGFELKLDIALPSDEELQQMIEKLIKQLKPPEPPPGFGEKFAEEFERGMERVAQALADAILSGDVSNAVEAFSRVLEATVSEAVSAAVSQALAASAGAAAGPIGILVGALAGEFASGFMEQLFGGGGGTSAVADQFQEMLEAIEDLVRESVPQFQGMVADLVDTLTILRESLRHSMLLTEGLAAITFQVEQTVNAILGLNVGAFGDRLSAAVDIVAEIAALEAEIAALQATGFEDPKGLDFGEFGGDRELQLERLREELQAALDRLPDQLDIEGFAQQLVNEFFGVDIQSQVLSLEATFQELADAIMALEGISDETRAALLADLEEAREMLEQELVLGVFGDLLDLWERSGIRQNELAEARAKLEQAQFLINLERVKLELALLFEMGKISEEILNSFIDVANDLSEWAGNWENFLEGAAGSIGRANVGRVGRGRDRRQERESLIDELERYERLRLDPVARELAELNNKFADLRERARRLGVPLERVNAAFQAAVEDLMRRVLEPLQAFRDELRGFGQSPAASLFGAQSEFERLLAEVRGGNLSAVDDLVASGRDFRSIIEATFGGTARGRALIEQMAAEIDAVLGDEGLAAALDPQVAELQTHTAQFNEMIRLLGGRGIEGASFSLPANALGAGAGFAPVTDAINRSADARDRNLLGIRTEMAEERMLLSAILEEIKERREFSPILQAAALRSGTTSGSSPRGVI